MRAARAGLVHKIGVFATDCEPKCAARWQRQHVTKPWAYESSAAALDARPQAFCDPKKFPKRTSPARVDTACVA
jgi:hypothetical protein